MSIFTSLLTKRRVKKAFAAVDANDVLALETLNIDPNTQRRALLGGHTFNWSETLLSRAVRQDAFAVAQWLLVHNANPLGGDGVSPDLVEGLLRRARRAQVRDGEVVENAEGKRVWALSDPNLEHKRSPLLSTFVALVHARRTTSHTQRPVPTPTVLSDSWGTSGVSDTEVVAWLDAQVPRYESQRLKARIAENIGAEGAPSPARKI